ncbi:MAG: cytochrome c3 family protein [Myxococcaceae bacterium]|nr:cytochrome c3 family protein [Myxococcaceae bacterium]
MSLDREVLRPFAVLLLASSGVGWAQVSTTRHNLGQTGLFPVRTQQTAEICTFCHSPHDTFMSRPLWNHQASVAPWTPYSSTTLQCTPPPTPGGTTPLCLSCHDGTVHLGRLDNLDGGPVNLTMDGTSGTNLMPAGPRLLGTDLRNDHPVGFTYDAGPDRELTDPTIAGNLLRSGTGTGRGDAVQCTSCHDPHTTANPKFVRVSTTNGTLCLRCHDKPGWTGSSHQTSTKVAPGDTRTVANLSCLNCHAPHNAPAGSPRLLREGALAGLPTLERTCYRCHTAAASGGIAANIEAEFAKAYRHPVAGQAAHEPVFPLAGAAEPVLNTTAHVECADCHNPHRATAANRLKGMRGVGIDAGLVDDVAGQGQIAMHEVCFRCHSSTVTSVIPGVTQSGLTPSDKRREFDPGNSAFHPVAAPGRNKSANLAAQLSSAGLTPNDTITCADCHASNATAGTRGRVTPAAGISGPHGSTNRALLRANFIGTWLQNDNPSSFNANNYALCFLCHDQTRLMSRRWADGARTNFYEDFFQGRENLHWYHLDDKASKGRASCKNCHFNVHSNVAAPNTIYRISYPTGVTLEFERPPDDVNTHLVSFSPDLLPFGGGIKPVWAFDVTSKQRACYVVCHGNAMGGWPYEPPSGDDP